MKYHVAALLILLKPLQVTDRLLPRVSADYVKGFGGKFGVQTDRQDKSALGWDHQEKLQLHESQKGNWFLVLVSGGLRRNM